MVGEFRVVFAVIINVDVWFTTGDSNQSDFYDSESNDSVQAIF